MSLFSEVTNVPDVLQTTLVPEDVEAKIHDWLFTAGNGGHLSIAELLRKHDHSGWTPQEYAAYRGYVDIAKFLEAHPRNTASTPGNPLSGTEAASFMPQSGEHSIASHELGKPPLHPPIKTTQLLVNLGSFDTKNSVAPVDLDPYLRMNDFHSQVGLSIEISADGANGPSQVMQLPIPEAVTDKLWAFSTTDPSEVKLVFNIVRQHFPDTHGERQTTLVGRGIASLNDLRRGLGVKRESLTRDYSIAILEKDTLNSIGTVTFTFLVAKPFSHEQSTSVKTDDLWNKYGPTKVVGHRGTLLNYAPDAISMC
jgi:glycerophosphodiester phosphodiesterase